MIGNAQTNRLFKYPIMVVLALLAAPGCGPSRTGIVKPVINTSASLAARGYVASPPPLSRIQEFARQSGGDWNKLGPMGKKYMLENVTDGNINAAKAMLADAANHPLSATAHP